MLFQCSISSLRWNQWSQHKNQRSGGRERTLLCCWTWNQDRLLEIESEETHRRRIWGRRGPHHRTSFCQKNCPQRPSSPNGWESLGRIFSVSSVSVTWWRGPQEGRTIGLRLARNRPQEAFLKEVARRCDNLFTEPKQARRRRNRAPGIVQWEAPGPGSTVKTLSIA